MDTTHSERLLHGNPSDRELTEQLATPLDQSPPWLKWAVLVTGAGAITGFTAIAYSMATGVGTWGNNIPVAWGFPITNFVWWIGIGHAGTFISAILLLLEQKWRTSINRIAETMTIFALMQAGLFPLLHLGRPWFFYWLVPYPSSTGAWPQFISVLTWDFAAIVTYFTVTIFFWYTALVPDLATMRDRVRAGWRKWIYGVLSLGWRGSARHWHHYKKVQLLLAGLATPLVLSVHSVVSMDFATSQLPGWHSTIFPPYFVAGAIFSGFAMVVQLGIPTRAILKLHNVITERHLDLIGKLMLVTGLVLAYDYVVEPFIAYYSGNEYERQTQLESRPFGAYAWLTWTTIFCNVVAIQPLWWKRVRTSPVLLFTIACFVQLGMWLERFVLIVTAEYQDFLPSSWDHYYPSVVDVTILLGTISFFVFLYLLMVRFLPFIPIAELREMRHELAKEGKKEART